MVLGHFRRCGCTRCSIVKVGLVGAIGARVMRGGVLRGVRVAGWQCELLFCEDKRRRG